MANRVIKDSIWTSPTLAACSVQSQLHFPRWLLMADDWGCFNADTDVICGICYPKMKVKKSDILKIRNEYFEIGLLFLWTEPDGREWGYFVSWESHHNFCNRTNADNDGKNQKHRRKTPEPPEAQVKAYLNKFSDTLGRFVTKSLNPNPNPNPNPICITDIEFEQFWKIYPTRNGKKIGKEKAKDFVMKNILKSDYSLLIQCTQNYAKSKLVADGFAKDAIRFLKDNYWREWKEPEKEQNGKTSNTSTYHRTTAEAGEYDHIR